MNEHERTGTDRSTRPRMDALHDALLPAAPVNPPRRVQNVYGASYKIRHFFMDRMKDLVTLFNRSNPYTADHAEYLASYETIERNIAEADLDGRGSDVSESLRDQVAAQRQRMNSALADEYREGMTQEDIERLRETKYREFFREAGETLRIGDPQEITLGGTKPMFQFKSPDGTRWLFKKAVNCVGFAKPEGAEATRVGALVQRLVDPKTAVEALRQGVVQYGDGSMQRRLEHVETGDDKLDLFSFSMFPEDATPEEIRDVERVSDQLLREHTTDWLLCNFDTKGENFIVERDPATGSRVVHGIDKEASFNHILDSRAQTMSTTYKPHTNQSLYNVMFQMYAQGRMELNLESVALQVDRVEAMPNEQYMAMFTDYIDLRAGDNAQEKAALQAAILERKTSLRDEYSAFFTGLINERIKAEPSQAAALRERYFGGPEGTEFRLGGMGPRVLPRAVSISETEPERISRALGDRMNTFYAVAEVTQGIDREDLIRVDGQPLRNYVEEYMQAHPGADRAASRDLVLADMVRGADDRQHIVEAHMPHPATGEISATAVPLRMQGAEPPKTRKPAAEGWYRLWAALGVKSAKETLAEMHLYRQVEAGRDDAQAQVRTANYIIANNQSVPPAAVAPIAPDEQPVLHTPDAVLHTPDAVLHTPENPGATRTHMTRDELGLAAGNTLPVTRAAQPPAPDRSITRQ